MSAQHTPGPWEFVEREVLEDGSVYPHHIIGSGAGLQVCYMESMAVAALAHKDPKSVWALNQVTPINARLIAAAPELLEACVAQHNAIDILMARLIGLDPTFRPTKSAVWPAVLRGNAAIAKASPSTTADAGVVG